MNKVIFLKFSRSKAPSAIRATLACLAAISFVLFGLNGCVAQDNGDTGQAAASAAQTTKTDSVSDSIPDSSTGSMPSTPEELQLASSAAEILNVPYNGTVVCTIGEPFYSEDTGAEVRSVSFYEDGKLCAGADFTEDGAAVGNVVYY